MVGRKRELTGGDWLKSSELTVWEGVSGGTGTKWP
jgi:hypothetical protein